MIPPLINTGTTLAIHVKQCHAAGARVLENLLEKAFLKNLEKFRKFLENNYRKIKFFGTLAAVGVEYFINIFDTVSNELNWLIEVYYL